MIAIGTPHTKGAGYYVNDKDLRAKQEADVQTCAHCQAVILMQQWTGGWCGREMKPLCESCAARAQLFGCEPFMRKIEEQMRPKMRFKKLRIVERKPPTDVPQPIIIGK